MAGKKGGPMSKSSIDTGWGLIYRLNTLFNKAEDCSLSGDFDKWNFILDRIFVNLCYKGNMEIKFDTDDPTEMPTRVVSVKMPDTEIMVFKKFREDIKRIKVIQLVAMRKRKRSDYENAKELHYNILINKDVWLRKIMMERGLYLKEFEFDPTRAMFGG